MTAGYDSTLSRAERKKHGVFYTPEPVVRYLLRATEPKGTVADLSCGDGAFLLAAARAGCPVIGIDRDPLALARATERLADCPSSHLICGDGLAPELPHTPDVVLGNPPYLEAKKADPATKALCRKRFPTIARGCFDIFVCFIKAGLDALPPGGRLGYIIPNKFLVSDYAKPLRDEILAQTTIEEIIDVSDLPTFKDAAVYPILLILRKTPPAPKHRVRTGHVIDLAQLENGDFPRAAIPQTRWSQSPRSIIWLPPADPAAATVIDNIASRADTVPLSALLDIRWTISFHRSGLRDQFIFPHPHGDFPQRLLGGKKFHGNADVRRYGTDWSGWWIDYDEARAKSLRNQLPPASLFAGPKIIIAQNARRLTSTLDTEGYYCKDTFLVAKPAADAPLPYLLALLNSTLLSFYYSIVFKATHVAGAYLHYLAGYLGELPIRIAEDTTPITTCVQTLLNPNLLETERTALEQYLDNLVYDLYDIPPTIRPKITAAVPHWRDCIASRRGDWNAHAHQNDKPITSPPIALE